MLFGAAMVNPGERDRIRQIRSSPHVNFITAELRPLDRRSEQRCLAQRSMRRRSDFVRFQHSGHRKQSEPAFASAALNAMAIEDILPKHLEAAADADE